MPDPYKLHLTGLPHGINKTNVRKVLDDRLSGRRRLLLPPERETVVGIVDNQNADVAGGRDSMVRHTMALRHIGFEASGTEEGVPQQEKELTPNIVSGINFC